MRRLVWGVVFLVLGLATVLVVPGEVASVAGSKAAASSASAPATGEGLKSREELEAAFVAENPRVMERVGAMRELSRRWPDRRTLDLLKKVQSEIPEANRNGWLARYLHSEIPRLEAAVAEGAWQAATSTGPGEARPE